MAEIERILDRAIGDAVGNGPDPVVLFSGGVDSGLIASRLAALGHRDTLLLNYCFGDDDSESLLAERMAAHLGLRFERLTRVRGLCDSLIAPGTIYPQPFSDVSVVPTSDLAHAVASRLAGEQRVLLDGTGADGAFGLIANIEWWSRLGNILGRIPHAVRQTASRIHSWGLWYQRGVPEYGCRLLRYSIKMPILSAIVATNPLAGIVYDGSCAHEVYRLLEDWIGAVADTSLSHRAVAADLGLVCANRYAQKAHAIFERAGLQVHYPFLQSEMVSLALASVGHWQTSEPKVALKRMLARQVPAGMVYRPKSPFQDPNQSVFRDPQFIAYLRSAGDTTSPISSVVRSQALVRACDLLASGRSVPVPLKECLWAAVFLDRWYRTASHKGE